MNQYTNILLDQILKCKTNNFADNYDEIQCGKPPAMPKKRWIEKYLDKRLPLNPLHTSTLARKFIHCLQPKQFYTEVIHHLGDMSYFYNLLKDDYSKNWLIQILAYRILGYPRVKLPRNNPAYWQDIADVRKLQTGEERLKAGRYSLPLFSLEKLGFHLKLNATAEGIAAAYVQQQYAYQGTNFICRAEPGDVVLDGGACWGDTTLYFAHEVGDHGKVFAFEFIPNNMTILNHNLNHNAHLLNRIEIVPHPLWNMSKHELYYLDHGPGSSITDTVIDQPASQVCETISIDDLVKHRQLSTVDFIKMDIEGAELPALKGAEQTLKAFRPKLAISVYHKPDDFLTIPRYLNELGLNYDFYLDHHTIHAWETVLFAVPRDRK